MEELEGGVEEQCEADPDHDHPDGQNSRAGCDRPPEPAPTAAGSTDPGQQKSGQEGHKTEAHQDRANIRHMASFAPIEDGSRRAGQRHVEVRRPEDEVGQDAPGNCVDLGGRVAGQLVDAAPVLVEGYPDGVEEQEHGHGDDDARRRRSCDDGRDPLHKGGVHAVIVAPRSVGPGRTGPGAGIRRRQRLYRAPQPLGE